MSMISTEQWLVTLGIFDITIVMSTLSSYRVAPCKGHLEHMRQLYRYIKHFPHAAVHLQTNIPDYSEMVHESQYGCTLLIEILKKSYHQMCPLH